jgi:hypothetical protein
VVKENSQDASSSSRDWRWDFLESCRRLLHLRKIRQFRRCSTPSINMSWGLMLLVGHNGSEGGEGQ